MGKEGKGEGDTQRTRSQNLRLIKSNIGKISNRRKRLIERKKILSLAVFVRRSTLTPGERLKI